MSMSASNRQETAIAASRSGQPARSITVYPRWVVINCMEYGLPTTYSLGNGVVMGLVCAIVWPELTARIIDRLRTAWLDGIRLPGSPDRPRFAPR